MVPQSDLDHIQLTSVVYRRERPNRGRRYCQSPENIDHVNFILTTPSNLLDLRIGLHIWRFVWTSFIPPDLSCLVVA